MPQKRPDKQQNLEEPPRSPRRDMRQPAPVDDEAFARRAGEIMANSSTLLQPRGAGNERPRRSGPRAGARAGESRREAHYIRVENHTEGRTAVKKLYECHAEDCVRAAELMVDPRRREDAGSPGQPTSRSAMILFSPD